MADEPGMDKGELRKLLTVAKKTPVNAAMGMTKDGMPAVLLHKIKQPRALSKELESSNPDLKNMRWGELYVDEEKDPKTLIARLNKPSSGLARKLIKVVKFAGFAKVLLQFEDGTSEEGGDEDAAGEAEAPTTGTPEPLQTGSPDLRKVASRLTDLVKRMLPLITADPSRQDPLKSLAKTAQAAIQDHDPPGAEKATDALERAVAGFEAATPASPAAAAIDPAIIAKARTAWLAVRQRVEAELDKLLDAIRTTYQDHGALAEIEKHVQKQLDTVLDALDEDLATKLEQAGKATGAERPQLIGEAKQIIARYQQHIATDKVLSSLDDNPFAPVAVQKTVTAALSALSHSIH